MAGEIVFGIFVVAMIVLAGFVVRFSMKLNRERRRRPQRRPSRAAPAGRAARAASGEVRPRRPGGSPG
jgi:hypothetical protein